jgi:hypothetical protein
MLGAAIPAEACNCDDWWRGRPLGWTRDSKALALHARVFDCACVTTEYVQLVDADGSDVAGRGIAVSESGRTWLWGSPEFEPVSAHRIRARRKAALAWIRAKAPVRPRPFSLGPLSLFVRTDVSTGDLQHVTAVGAGRSACDAVTLWRLHPDEWREEVDLGPVDLGRLWPPWVPARAYASPDRRSLAIMAKGWSADSPTFPVRLPLRDLAEAAWEAFGRARGRDDLLRAQAACAVIRSLDRGFYDSRARKACRPIL